MINIPVEIQELFKTNSVRKCFHVHFPNGEFRDLWNSDIVTESVTFKESLCSQQYLKFGLTEASSIEFECVGIPNIRGAVIQCAIEIDITSLGESWISAHSESKDIVIAVESGNAMGAENGNAIGGTIYGSEYFLDPQVVTSEGFMAYRIPYGEFVVDSCPRNHGAMAHRKITAYGKQVTEAKLEIDGMHKSPNMRINPLIYMQASNTKLDEMDRVEPYEMPASAAERSGFGSYVGSARGALTSSGSDPLVFRGVYYVRHRITVSNPTRAKKILIYASFPDSIYTEQGVSLFNTAAQPIPSGYMYFVNDEKAFNSSKQAAAAVSGLFKPSILVSHSFVNWYYPTMINSGKYYIVDLNNLVLGVKNDVQSNLPLYVEVQIPVVWSPNAFWQKDTTTYAVNDWPIDEMYYSINGVPSSQNISKQLLMDQIDVRYKVIEETDSNFEMNIGQTLEVSQSALGKYYTYANAFSFSDMVSGYYELCGTFERQERDGSHTEYLLSNNNPYSMTPEDYSDLWWEEYSVQPIGRLEYEWADGDDTKSGSLTLSSGKSVYSFADNYVLKHLYKPTESKIRSLLRTHFVPKIRNVAFTPIDLNARGLPFLEAGDYLNLTAYDGTAVNSYILERTIKGIQSLQDTIASEGGEVIE